jgi:hypothetical protein
MTTHENSRSRPNGAESPLKDENLVKKCRVADPKINFAKIHEVYSFVLKCKLTPVLAKSAGDCAKFKIYLRRLLQ